MSNRQPEHYLKSTSEHIHFERVERRNKYDFRDEIDVVSVDIGRGAGTRLCS